MKHHRIYFWLVMLISLTIACFYTFWSVGTAWLPSPLGFFLLWGYSLLSLAVFVFLHIYASSGRSLGLVAALRRQKHCLVLGLWGTLVFSFLCLFLASIGFILRTLLAFFCVASSALLLISQIFLTIDLTRGIAPGFLEEDD